MSTDRVADFTDQATLKLLIAGRTAREAQQEPPSAIDLRPLRHLVGVTVSRYEWHQELPPITPAYQNPVRFVHGVEGEWTPIVAEQVTLVRDPLLDLATRLTEVSSRLRELGLSPVGINVSTSHVDNPESFTRQREDKIAVVAITVTALPRDQVDEIARQQWGDDAEGVADEGAAR